MQKDLRLRRISIARTVQASLQIEGNTLSLDQVTALINELFTFVTALELHPIITSSVLHYEFEYIHPFSDGNGRLGRLWQTLILYRWKPVFAVIPIESVIRDHQEEYYAALNPSNKVHPGSFVEFMLRIILESLRMFEPPVAPPVKAC